MRGVKLGTKKCRDEDLNRKEFLISYFEFICKQKVPYFDFFLTKEGEKLKNSLSLAAKHYH
jgi:hypothetical protein